MADAKISALSSHGTPVGADYLASVLASGPTSKKLLLSDARDYVNMVQASLADADTTMAINTLYVGSMSAWATADRTYTLPATAAVGDMCGIMITAGNATTFELLYTANTGDTLDGIAGGTERSRVFITGEVVLFRCVTTNSAWVTHYDGRIPMVGFIRLSTDAPATEVALTYYYPTVPASGTPGAWTADSDIGNVTAVATDKITARRACRAFVSVTVLSTGNMADLEHLSVIAELNGAGSGVIYQKVFAPGTVAVGTATGAIVSFAAGDYIRFKYRHSKANTGIDGASVPFNSLGLMEIL